MPKTIEYHGAVYLHLPDGSTNLLARTLTVEAAEARAVAANVDGKLLGVTGEYRAVPEDCTVTI